MSPHQPRAANLVQTTVLTPIVEFFRNKLVTQRPGIQILAGLQGNIAIPRQTGAATAYTLAEQGTVTKSTQVINQIAMTPHRVGATNSYTKQLLLQSSVDVEDFVRDDLMKVRAIKIDYLVLQGKGALTRSASARLPTLAASPLAVGPHGKA